MIYLTADLHLGHARVIEYSHRPFANADEMDAAIISRWNERVTDADTIYVLGDVSFHRAEKTANLLRRLRGQKFLVLGNHDKDTTLLKKFFGWLKDLYVLRVPDENAPDNIRRVVLCHYAMRTWYRSHHGTWQLYGHSHMSLTEDPHCLSFDVGVDGHDFYPWSYDEVAAKMATKTFRPVDHHGTCDD